MTCDMDHTKPEECPMTSIQLKLHGGPHDRKEGWFHSQDGAPDTVYVSDQPSYNPIIVAYPVSRWSHGPYHTYRLDAVNPDDVYIYQYDPEATT